jgi:hypothetical protein
VQMGEIIEANNLDVNYAYPDDAHMTPMHYAARSGKKKVRVVSAGVHWQASHIPLCLMTHTHNALLQRSPGCTMAVGSWGEQVPS